jgi:hypothetical protein
VSNTGYVALAWVTVGATVGLYALRVIARGRKLARRLPGGGRRWM